MADFPGDNNPLPPAEIEFHEKPPPLPLAATFLAPPTWPDPKPPKTPPKQRDATQTTARQSKSKHHRAAATERRVRKSPRVPFQPAREVKPPTPAADRRYGGESVRTVSGGLPTLGRRR